MGVKTAVKGAESLAKPIVKTAGELATEVGESGVAKGIKDASKVISENAQALGSTLKQAPERIATNAEAMKVARQEVEQLPITAQKAVKNGIDIRDAQLLTEPVTVGERIIQKKMLKASELFGKTRSAEDPALIGGSVVTKRLNDLKKIVDIQGKKLGEVVATIPDRKVIQDAWNSLYGRGGQDMHKLRQELFEVIKKQAKGAEGFTKTKDEAIQAIRMGISDGLDAVSPGYKALNQQYAKVINPYEKLDSFFKKLKDQGEDVMSERGATLLRNLTSRNVKAPEIRGILKQVDEALVEFGKKSNVNLEKVQNFYDALQRTFDITPDQSFGGQIRTADIPMNASGIINKTIGAVLDKASITPEVRRKAFKDLFDSISGPKASEIAE